MADAPQVVYASSALEVDRTHEHPHAVHQSFQDPGPSRVRSPWPAKADQSKSDHEQTLPVARILVFRRRTLWALCVVAVRIIGGTVGGSIGGVMVVQGPSAHTGPVVSNTTANTVFSQTSSTVSSQNAAVVAASTITGSASSSSLIAAAPTFTIDSSCPSTLRSYNSKLYDCIAKRNTNEAGDIIAILAYTIQQCVDAYSNMNVIAGSVKCRAVAMTNGLDYEYKK